MAKQPRMTVRVGWRDLVESQQRGLLSAMNSLGPQLGAEFVPAGAADADLLIVAAAASAPPPAQGRQQQITLADRRDQARADLVRPFRVAELRSVLAAALDRLRQAPASPAAPRMYRGVPVESSGRAAGRAEADERPRAGLVYRGSRVG